MSSDKYFIRRIEELRLTDELESNIAVLLSECMSLDYEGRSFFQNRFHCRFIVEHKGRIIGHLAIAHRSIRLGKDLVDIIGIGEVAVATSFRHQGIGSRLLEAALDEGRTARADFAALFGEKSMYAGAGFVHAPNRLTLSEMEGSKTGFMVREFNDHFMICPLGDRQWNSDVLVDLAGFPF